MTTTYAANNRLLGLEYRFSPDRLAELNRAPVPLLLARITTGCPSYGKTAVDIDSVDTLIAEIRGHCASDTDFIRQSMPLQEIVFRTLLLDADSTMTLGQLHQELTERWSSAIRPITVTLSGLARILDSDEFYGFEAIPVDDPELADLPMLTASGADDSDGLAQIIAAIAANVDDEEDDDDDLFEEDEDDEGDDTDLFIDDSPDNESEDAESEDAESEDEE